MMSNANAQSILDEMNEIAELEAMAQRLKELQWEKLLLELVDTGVLRAFIEENKDQLSYKETK